MRIVYFATNTNNLKMDRNVLLEYLKLIKSFYTIFKDYSFVSETKKTLETLKLHRKGCKTTRLRVFFNLYEIYCRVLKTLGGRLCGNFF